MFTLSEGLHSQIKKIEKKIEGICCLSRKPPWKTVSVGTRTRVFKRDWEQPTPRARKLETSLSKTPFLQELGLH